MRKKKSDCTEEEWALIAEKTKLTQYSGLKVMSENAVIWLSLPWKHAKPTKNPLGATN